MLKGDLLMRRAAIAAFLLGALFAPISSWAADRQPAAVPSWFWGRWKIVTALSPYQEGAPSGALTGQVTRALIGRVLFFGRGCASFPATAVDRPMPSGRVTLRDPHYFPTKQSEGEWGNFPLSALGITGGSAIDVATGIPSSVPLGLELVGSDVYLRRGSLIVEVEGGYFLARKTGSLPRGRGCLSPSPGAPVSVTGIPAPLPWWRTPWLPDAERGRLIPVWKCATTSCASARLAAAPHEDGTARVVYYATPLRLDPNNNAAALGPLENIPTNQDAYSRLAMLPSRLYTRVNVAFGLAAAKNREAMHGLGWLLRFGRGVRHDPKRGLLLHPRAARMGFAEAQFSAGVCLSRGEGVQRDVEEAFRWYLRAARRGHADAAHNVAYFYRVGRGVERDAKRAKLWSERAKRYAVAERAKRRAEAGSR